MAEESGSSSLIWERLHPCVLAAVCVVPISHFPPCVRRNHKELVDFEERLVSTARYGYNLVAIVVHLTRADNRNSYAVA